ncbi:MAG: hypothetical protein R2710_07095 [Acidimicrobiales bacterium]
MSAAPSGPPPLVARLVMYLTQTIGVSLASIVVMTMLTSAWWRLTPHREVDILVYDQNVPNETYGQHGALAQIFEYHRVPYALDDYVGLTPGTWEPHGEWPEQQPDLIVLADVTGVYLDENNEPDEFGGRPVGEVIWPSQAEDIQRWVAAGTPAYGEFSMVVEPTPGRAGAILEDVFGVSSTGWRIRMFDDLTLVSPGIRNLGAYPWPYTGRGLVAVSGPAGGRNQGRNLVVLTEEQLDGFEIRIIGGPPGSPGGNARFDGWVEVVQPDPGTELDAVFELPVNADGAKMLARMGLPTRFAALVRTDRTLYFAGDGLRDETPFRLRKLKGGATFTRLVTGDEFQFLYQVLEPSFGWLLDRVPESTDQVASTD